MFLKGEPTSIFWGSLQFQISKSLGSIYADILFNSFVIWDQFIRRVGLAEVSTKFEHLFGVDI